MNTISVEKLKKITNYREREKALERLRRNLHKYIRLRDLMVKGVVIMGECISCKKQWFISIDDRGEITNNRGKWVAGHYYKADRYKAVEFDPDNIHLQCYVCNRHLHGNESAYAENLIKKIGNDRFNELTRKKNGIYKPNILEIEELSKKYRELAKQEEKRLGLKAGRIK